VLLRYLINGTDHSLWLITKLTIKTTMQIKFGFRIALIAYWMKALQNERTIYLILGDWNFGFSLDKGWKWIPRKGLASGRNGVATDSPVPRFFQRGRAPDF